MVVVVGYSGAGVARWLDSYGQMADEALRPEYVVRSELRPMDVRAADRALDGVAWRRPDPSWTHDDAFDTGHIMETHTYAEASRARVGKLTFHSAEEGTDFHEPDWTELSVSTPYGGALRCSSFTDYRPRRSQETVLEFRQTSDLRVTQFRCRMVYWGAERGPWVEPRMAIEHAVSRERIGPSPAASEAVRSYRMGFRWLLVAYWLTSALALAVELPLHRLRRRSSSPLPSPYRGVAVVPEQTGRPWRSNVIVRARWWIWFGAIMASIAWSHAKFPIALWGSRTAQAASPAPAMEAIPAAPLGSVDGTSSAANAASDTMTRRPP